MNEIDEAIAMADTGISNLKVVYENTLKEYFSLLKTSVDTEKINQLQQKFMQINRFVSSIKEDFDIIFNIESIK